MPTIIIANHQFDYDVSYSSRRRTVQIRLVSPSSLEVAAPKRLAKGEIEALLKLKTAWIIKQMERFTKLASNPVNSTLEQGAKLLYQGEVKELAILSATGRRTQVHLAGDLLIARLTAAEQGLEAALTDALRRWYLKAATELLAAKTTEWAAKIGVRYGRITIREQKTRWGSCSNRANLNYNWRIIMAPLPIIDYLVVHELCHIRVPNHSPAFWQLVGEFIPDFKERREWLRRNGSLLSRGLRPGS